jgi:4-amino-4-deoxy-L-arabinose transferase-like glycosyltransferase
MNDATPSLLSRHRGLRWLLLALVLALSAWIQFTNVSRTEIDDPLRTDAGRYFSYAWNLHEHGVYSGAASWAHDPAPVVPDAVLSPGYPVFLALVPGIAPDLQYIRRVTFIQATLAVASVWLLYLLAASFLGPGGGLCAALLTALSPHLAIFSTLVLTETLFLFLLLLSMLATLRALRRGDGLSFVLAGVAWAACSLVRSTAQFLPLLLMLLALCVPALRAQRRGALLLFAAFLAVQAPWIVRNRLIPDSGPKQNLMVDFLQHGSYPNFMYEGNPESLGFPYAFDPKLKESTKDLPSVLGNIAGHFRAEPVRYARWYLLGKPAAFLGWDTINGYEDIFEYPPNRTPYLEDPLFVWLRLLALWLHWPLMLLGFGGAMFVAWRPQAFGIVDGRRQMVARFVALVVLYAIAFHMVGAPFPCYAAPFRPLLYTLAVSVLAAPFLRARARAAAALPAGATA